MLRVCVIGMGPIGRRHATLLQADPLADLVGVCDRLRERADAAAAAFGVPAFYEAEAMLRALAPDVTHVATGGVEYGSDHYEPTMQALAAGCHVLGEKPISNIVEEAGEMVAKARQLGLCYGINLNHRFTPAARVAKRWVDEGRIGHQLFCRMSMWIKNPAESSPWYQIKALNPHTVDVMRYFCGDIEQVQLFATKAPGRSIWSTTSFNMRFSSGAIGNLTASYDIERGHPMERCEVGGTQRPLRAGRHVARGDAVSRRRPDQAGLQRPGLRRLRRFHQHLRRAYPSLPAANQRGRQSGRDRGVGRGRPGRAAGAVGGDRVAAGRHDSHGEWNQVNRTGRRA